MAYIDKSHREMFILTPFQLQQNKTVTSVVGHGSSVGWHQGCHSPAQGCCSASVSKCGSIQLWKEWENKDERIQNHFAISVRSPFPLFFLWVSLIKQCLSAFTLMALHSSPHHLTPFYLSGQCLPQCWRAADAWLPSLLLYFDPTLLCFLLLHSHPAEELRHP